MVRAYQVCAYRARIDHIAHRIRSIMADAVRYRTEHAILETELFKLQKIVNSSRLHALPTEAGRNLRTRIATLEAQSAEKTKQLSGIVDRLVATNFWPILSGGNVAGNYAEAKRHLDEVRANVTEMYEKIKALTAPWQRTFSAVEPDIDGGLRPAKRRRTDGSSADDDEADSKALEELKENLEGRIVELENHFLQHEENLWAALDARIEEKIEENIETLQTQSDARRDYLLGELTAAQAARSKEFDDSLQQMGNEISELVKEVAQLVTSDQDQELQNLRDDNTLLRARIAAVCDEFMLWL